MDEAQCVFFYVFFYLFCAFFVSFCSVFLTLKDWFESSHCSFMRVNLLISACARESPHCSLVRISYTHVHRPTHHICIAR
jgi:hypothetical protein